jgi:hydrogenase/urease accessory protein HupE
MAMQLHLRKRVGPATAILLLFLAPATAEAHSDLRLGPPPFRLGPLLGIFAPVSALALLISLTDHATPVPALLTTSLAVALGALLASGKITSRAVDLTLLAIAALLLGLDSGFTNPSALMVAKVLFGNWVCLLVIIGYVAFYTSLLPSRPWTQRAFRVAGSWIVAIGLLALILALRAP